MVNLIIWQYFSTIQVTGPVTVSCGSELFSPYCSFTHTHTQKMPATYSCLFTSGCLTPFTSLGTWANHVVFKAQSYLWNRNKKVWLNNWFLHPSSYPFFVPARKFCSFLINDRYWLNLKSECFPKLQHMTIVSPPGDTVTLKMNALSQWEEGAADTSQEPGTLPASH